MLKYASAITSAEIASQKFIVIICFCRCTEWEENDPGGGGGGGGGDGNARPSFRDRSLPAIDEWGEIVLNDETTPALANGAAQDDVATVMVGRQAASVHIREAESRGFHDESVGRPAFGYEHFDDVILEKEEEEEGEEGEDDALRPQESPDNGTDSKRAGNTRKTGVSPAPLIRFVKSLVSRGSPNKVRRRWFQCQKAEDSVRRAEDPRFRRASASSGS